MQQLRPRRRMAECLQSGAAATCMLRLASCLPQHLISGLRRPLFIPNKHSLALAYAQRHQLHRRGKGEAEFVQLGKFKQEVRAAWRMILCCCVAASDVNPRNAD